MICVRVEEAPFDIGVEIARLEGDGVGAIASFVGIVRGDGGLRELRLDHYPAMTEQVLTKLSERAAARWHLLAMTIVHRVGSLVPGERIVFVGCGSAHRAEALEACGFVIDTLKTSAPFWKQESFGDDAPVWVEVRDGDLAAAARWN